MEAESLGRRALAICEKALGPNHPDTAASLNNLGELLRSKGDYAGAELLYRRALAICEKGFGDGPPKYSNGPNEPCRGFRVRETGKMITMSRLFEVATRISTPWALAAFAIVAIFFLVFKLRGKVPPIPAIVAIVLLGLVPIIIAQLGSPAIYRVRVTVVGPQGTPVDDAKVWSSMGGESKKVAGGWQFDIPAAARPADGALTIWASLESAYLKGSQEVRLADDRNPGVTVRLDSDKTATVRGLVMDRRGRAIVGARVSVTGYQSEATVTQAGGDFMLPSHAATTQNVLLHAEANGYAGVTQWHMAGDQPATIVLDRR